ncbi:MAG: thioredoxin family protein [Pirellulaceae bacterium]
MVKASYLSGMGLLAVLTCATAVRAESLKVGDKAPNFKAETVDGKVISLEDAKGAKALVVSFTCNECPVAVAYEDRFIEFAKKYADKDVKFFAINVNSTEDLEAMKKRAEEKGFQYPYAYDASGKSAEAYGARVTPHLFVIDAEGVVAYIGSFDDNMNHDKATKHFVVDAVEALLEGKKPETTETKAFGCTIKR